jgi:hypothetical protein
VKNKKKRKKLSSSKTVPLIPLGQDRSLTGFFKFVERGFWQTVKDCGLNRKDYFFEIKKDSMQFGMKVKVSKYVLCRARKRGIPYIFDNTPFLPVAEFEQQFKAVLTIPSIYPRTYAIGLKGVLYELSKLKKKYPLARGFSIYANPISGRGIDILVVKGDEEPQCVYEITNYGKNSYLADYTFNRYMNLFSRWVKYVKCKRYFVASFKKNLYNRKLKKDYLPDFKNNGITVVIRQKQA